MKNNTPNKHLDLIYDVGMHKGEDTDFYLKKGFKVIGFEANPDLVLFCKNRFKAELESGKLIIKEGAIIEIKNTDKTTKFYKNTNVSVWGTVLNNWADRNEHLGSSNDIIEVPVVDFSECIKEYGVPYYLKIDIEGMDTLCLQALLNFKERPNYISIESEKVSFKKLEEEFNLFKKLGYKKFKIINQKKIKFQNEPKNSNEGIFSNYKFEEGSSGLFGSDLRCKWINYKKSILKYKFIFLGYKLFGDFGIFRKNKFANFIKNVINKIFRIEIPGWYDTHAKL